MRSNNYNIGTDSEDMGSSNYRMYTDDTTLYSDILPYDINVPASDALISSDNIFGKISPALEQIANSLLPSEATLPLMDDVSFDVDIAQLDSITPQNDEVLGSAMENLMLEPAGQQLQAAQPRRRSERLSNRTVNMPTSSEEHLSWGRHSYPAFDIDTTVEESQWSPMSNADGTDGSEWTGTRKRRPRISYNTLTEEEKYQRIRDLNNEASRQYRGRRRDHLTCLQEKETRETQRNEVLKAKAVALERLRDEIKEYTYNFFKEHVGNHGAQ